MMMNSLHGRLTVFLLLGTGGLLLLAGLGLSYFVESWLQNEFDRTLRATARALVTLTAQGAGEVELDFADEFMPEFEDPERPAYFQLWLGDGTLVERSRSLRGLNLPRSSAEDEEPRFRNLRLPDGRHGRLIEIHFVPQIADEDDRDEDVTRNPRIERVSAILVVARDREDLDALIRLLNVSFSVVAAVLMVAIAVLVGALLRFGLRPLDEVSRQVEALDAESLDVRIRVPSPPAEIVPVIARLNALLQRLEDAFERERRLSSDVAHELRTPIAELRSIGDVAGRWPGDPESVARFFTDVREIALQMERIVVHLLALARCEAGLETVRVSAVELVELFASIRSRLSREAAKRGIAYRDELPAALWVATDRDKIEMLLFNLLANAVAYSPKGSEVRCTARKDEGRATFEIANQAVHLTPHDVPKMFERFWRKDEARSGGQHLGLGLARVRAFAELLDLDIDAAVDEEQTFRVTVSGLRICRPAVRVCSAP